MSNHLGTQMCLYREWMCQIIWAHRCVCTRSGCVKSSGHIGVSVPGVDVPNHLGTQVCLYREWMCQIIWTHRYVCTGSGCVKSSGDICVSVPGVDVSNHLETQVCLYQEWMCQIIWRHRFVCTRSGCGKLTAIFHNWVCQIECNMGYFDFSRSGCAKLAAFSSVSVCSGVAWLNQLTQCQCQSQQVRAFLLGGLCTQVRLPKYNFDSRNYWQV